MTLKTTQRDLFEKVFARLVILSCAVLLAGCEKNKVNFFAIERDSKPTPGNVPPNAQHPSPCSSPQTAGTPSQTIATPPPTPTAQIKPTWFSRVAVRLQALYYVGDRGPFPYAHKLIAFVTTDGLGNETGFTRARTDSAGRAIFKNVRAGGDFRVYVPHIKGAVLGDSKFEYSPERPSCLACVTDESPARLIDLGKLKVFLEPEY